MKPIAVNLLSTTPDAPSLLVYTKNTRLEQSPDAYANIAAMPEGLKLSELEYMANTIPSSWEFVDYVFQINNVTRAFTHQFVRTRTGSYAQQTMRVLAMDGFTYRIPPRYKLPGNEHLLGSYKGAMEQIQKYYDWQIQNGAEIEDARGILPTNIHTNIIAKFNLRTLAEMLQKREGMRTQDEYREVLDKMLSAVLEVHPWAKLFLQPEDRQVIKGLETFVEEQKAAGHIDAMKARDLHKLLDLLRKGAQ